MLLHNIADFLDSQPGRAQSRPDHESRTLAEAVGNVHCITTSQYETAAPSVAACAGPQRRAATTKALVCGDPFCASTVQRASNENDPTRFKLGR